MSPLRFFTKRQTEKTKKRIQNKKIEIDYAMRYGNPSIDKNLKILRKKVVKTL